jgi:hypothetical protein
VLGYSDVVGEIFGLLVAVTEGDTVSCGDSDERSDGFTLVSSVSPSEINNREVEGIKDRGDDELMINVLFIEGDNLGCDDSWKVGKADGKEVATSSPLPSKLGGKEGNI